ncbi:MAG: CcmD family protein [Chloroflexi bacterium]|nr:CcmD family protein [Chloroflexota bacterium]
MPRVRTLPLLGVAWVAPLLQRVISPQGKEPEANLPYLFVVFAVTWIAFFAYAFFMSRRQQELRRELDSIRKLLEQQTQATKGSPEAQDKPEQRKAP